MAAVQVPWRFAAFTLGKDQAEVKSFWEKPDGDGAWINGGSFVLESQVIDYIKSDLDVWKRADAAIGGRGLVECLSP